MSGIVGIVNLDYSPVDRILLQNLTRAIAFRGPDAQKTWLQGPVGFGHTLLRTGKKSENENQPLTLDGNTWIVADARVDGRRELMLKLEAQGQKCAPEAPAAELILRAYETWGEECLNHLIGDFVFAIWNVRTSRLFCARDQMGVKPFFYARVGSSLVFSNTLDCIRQNPAVSNKLNDLSIADFLLFDMIQDPASTAFAEIHRLPAAHSLTCDGATISIKRYWTFSPPEPIRYARSSDYVEHFRALMDQAVADRLQTPSACIFMSGGLDSPAVAVSAKNVAARDGNATDLWALTQVFNSLIPHDEKYYAGLVADALHLPIQYQVNDDLRLFQFAERPTPEPADLGWPNATIDHLQRVSSKSRVVLTGFGADPLFSSRITVHFRELLQQKRFGRAVADAARYLAVEGRLSRLYLRTRWRILFASKEKQSGFFPGWLNDDFAGRLALRDRWETCTASNLPAGAVRPEAHEVTFASFWPDLFNYYDASVTGVPVEVRHPFFDLRLMTYLLALPRLPWCCDKQLLREAIRGVLPDSVRVRRKSPLRADPLLRLLDRPDAAWVDHFEPDPQLHSYIVPNRIPAVLQEKDSWTAWVNLRPLSLNYWLRKLNASSVNKKKHLEHELTPIPCR